MLKHPIEKDHSMKATKPILFFLVFFMILVKSHAGVAFSPLILDTEITCHLVTETHNGLLVGDLLNLGNVSAQFESTKSEHINVVGGNREFIFGFGKAEFNQMVRSWDANKNEILTPLHVAIEVSLDAKNRRKLMNASISIVNPFTNLLETQKSFESKFSVSDSFIYTNANFRSSSNTTTIGDFSNLHVHCEFGVSNSAL